MKRQSICPSEIAFVCAVPLNKYINLNKCRHKSLAHTCTTSLTVCLSINQNTYQRQATAKSASKQHKRPWTSPQSPLPDVRDFRGGCSLECLFHAIKFIKDVRHPPALRHLSKRKEKRWSSRRIDANRRRLWRSSEKKKCVLDN